MTDFSAVGLLLAGFVFLIGGSELMVRFASKLGLHYGLRPVIIGMTIVAFGTSAPEIVVTWLAAFDGRSGLALGNAVGSNIANIGLVLGVAALVSPLTVSKQIVKVEYLCALLATVLAVWLVWDLTLDRDDGIVLCGAFAIFFVVYMVRALAVRGAVAGEGTVEALAGKKHTRPLTCWILTLLGIAVLVLGASWVVAGASDIARSMGMGEETVAATIVAFGTSLPEVAATVMAALKKEHELAVGNVLGSNIFNMLCVLGPVAIYPGLDIEGDLVHIHLVVLIGFSILLLPLMLTKSLVGRRSGLLLVGLYVLFFALNAAVELEWISLPEWMLS